MGVIVNGEPDAAALQVFAKALTTAPASVREKIVLLLIDTGRRTDPLTPKGADTIRHPRILETLRESSAINSFRVGVPNPLQSGSPTGFTVFEFQGFVTTFPFSATVDAALTGTVSIRLTGPITKT